uniref:Large ribosomal subunit protein uL5c n=1 Tax=prasinophyte sp. MBIC10622 TaxID=156113 RepID=A0A650AKI8_9CHLO|nr:ribosomal protein L5 [prasinophyte sp. MBIC10622]
MTRSFYHYTHVIRKDLAQKFCYQNLHQVPKLTHISLHMSTGKAILDPSILVPCAFALETVSGQHPIVTRAQRSVAAFKLREGMVLGCSVTLRNQSMYEFLDKLVVQVLPRVPEFSGLSMDSADSMGHYTFGIPSLLSFPELDPYHEILARLGGLQVTCTTNAPTSEEALALLSGFQLPFAHHEHQNAQL